MNKIAVIGGGAWGTALAAVAARASQTVMLWAREAEVVRAINDTRENTVFLPGHRLPDGLTATDRMADLEGADAVLMVAPAQHLRAVATAFRRHVAANVPVLICSKGIEIATGQLMSTVLAETLPDQIAMVLSGPTFAAEVADGLPCALTLATDDEFRGMQVVDMLAKPTFRIYLSDDIAGAQIGGAIKNVLAIATGVVAGLGLGENARAAVITRGLAEMIRFGALFGAERDTLMGLSGVGDLILTCSSTQSRNMSLGKALGEGQTLAEIMTSRNSVAEGAHTVEVVNRIAQTEGIDMPITEAVYAILKGGADVGGVLETLLARPFTFEDR